MGLDHGLDDLILRLGAGNEPTGLGVTVGQVEANDASANYGPDTSHADFVGNTFIYMSGATGISGHATNIGRRIYGSGGLGIAPEIENVYVYSAAGWVQNDFLNLNTSNNPGTPPGNISIFNHSWIGSFGNTTLDMQALRRSDWSVDNSNVMMICGIANSGSHNPLMAFGFNGVSVGMSNGEHTAGEIPSGYDSSGSQIPLIVATQNTTSAATGVVSAATSLIIETAETHPNTSGNFFATLSETTKVVLLAGGRHEGGWTNNPILSGPNRGRTNQPIDETFGVGTVNVDRSWQVMAGGQHSSSATPTNLISAPYAGWENWLLSSNQSRYIRLDVPTLADEVSIVLTWHQVSNSSFSAYTIADLNIELMAYNGGKPTSLVGDVGLGVFGSGNVVSESEFDNVEHLYIKDLSPGEYVLKIHRVDLASGSRVFGVGWLLPEPDAGVPGDLNGDGVVDVNDLLVIIGAWGVCSGECAADLTGDGMVDVLDILELLSLWS
ncbi:MAG: hypothetical protein HOC27_00405 [Phycisphaerae bacterium]|nr:hypothetical protein [Phycisphaerae bacterium]